MSDFEFGMDWKWLDPRPSAGPNAELDRSQLLSGAHTINDHISTSPGQSQLQICLLNPNNILVNPKQRISVSLILRVCSQKHGNSFCQFRTLDSISLRMFWIWTMKLFCWRGETGDSCRVLQVKQALAKKRFYRSKVQSLEPLDVTT